MKLQLDWSKAPWWLLATLALGAGLAACATEDVDDEEAEPSGSAGSSSSTETGGSANGTADESSTETGGAPSEGGADDGTSGAAGDAGSSTAGGGGSTSAATGGAGGVDCTEEPCTPAECVPIAPSDPLITDWANVEPSSGLFVDNDTFSDAPSWWEGFFGGPFAYPVDDPCAEEELPDDLLAYTWNTGALELTGTVGTYAGFGLWLENCMIDMSGYTGISFKLWGNAGPTGTLTMRAFTSETTEQRECQTNVGTCDPTVDTCTTPTYVITIPEAEETIEVAWTDFAGGSPVSGVNPAEIWQLQWEFDWAGETDTPYEIALTLDDITLVDVGESE